MRARGTLILLLLCAAAAGFIFWFERERPTPEEREEEARMILDLDPAAITSIRLAWRESTLAVERRDGSDRWRLVEPRAGAADQAAVSDLAAMFDGLQTERWIEASDADIAGTGLQDPWVRVTVTAGDSLHQLAVGHLNPTRSAYFARLDSDPRIALLTTWIADSNLNRTWLSLREKHIASFDLDAARRIELLTPTSRRTLIQEDGEWRIADPPLAADETAVRGLLSRLNQIEVVEFVGEDGDVKAGTHGTGLTKPQFVATVTGDADSVLARIEIGARGPTGRYARSTFQPATVIVPFTIEEDLSLDVDELRDQRLVALAGSEIDTLEVAAGGREAVIARDSSGVFVRVSGGNAGDDDSEVNRVAANLPYVRVTGFVDDRPAITPAEQRRYGLDPPSLQLRLKLRNGERRDLAFGGTGAEGVYAHRPGAGVVWVDQTTLDDLRRLAGSQEGPGTITPTSPNRPSTGNPR